MICCKGCSNPSKTDLICDKCGLLLHQDLEETYLLFAVILALVLGGLGVHRFYIGFTSHVDRRFNYTCGVLMLLFSVTLIPSVISMIEAVVFIFTKDSFNRKYNS